MNVTPNKKAPIDWSDEDADQVLKSVLSVVSPDMRKAAERDIRDLMARAWLLGEATRTVRPEAEAMSAAVLLRQVRDEWYRFTSYSQLKVDIDEFLERHAPQKGDA